MGQIGTIATEKAAAILSGLLLDCPAVLAGLAADTSGKSAADPNLERADTERGSGQIGSGIGIELSSGLTSYCLERLSNSLQEKIPDLLG